MKYNNGIMIFTYASWISDGMRCVVGLASRDGWAILSWYHNCHLASPAQAKACGLLLALRMEKYNLFHKQLDSCWTDCL